MFGRKRLPQIVWEPPRLAAVRLYQLYEKRQKSNDRPRQSKNFDNKLENNHNHHPSPGQDLPPATSGCQIYYLIQYGH